MADDPIWTRDDIVRFTYDDEVEIRSWAWTWLCRHHSEEAMRQMARGLADSYSPIGLEALDAFETHPTPEAAIAIESARARDDLPPVLREAIERLGRPAPPKRAPSAEQIAQARLDSDPEALRRLAPAMLLAGDELDYMSALQALGRQQHRWATDIILEHFPVLVTSYDDTELWMALEELLDPRSLPAILAAWSPGQCRAAKIYARIHHLADLSGPLPKGVARDAEEAAHYDERRTAFHKTHGRAASYSGHRRIQFLCPSCRRTGEYECDPATMAMLARTLDAHKNDLRVPTRFPCKFCDERGPLELTLLSMLSVVGGAMAYAGEGTRRR